MPRPNQSPLPSSSSIGLTVAGCAYGAWLGLALLKFGNPIILDRLIESPRNVLEMIHAPWPVAWGYALLGLLLLGSLGLVRRDARTPRWLVLAPLIWLGWQLISATQTVDARLTKATLLHFTSCVACFYYGLFVLSREPNPRFPLLGLLVGFVLVLSAGLDQHFGGLEATRQWVKEQPGWEGFPPEYLRRIESNRIFGTLFYPNTLAGVILLLLPPLGLAWFDLTRRFLNVLRGVLVGLLGYCALACLFWTGSKSGWLVAMAMSFVLVLHLRIPRPVKVTIAVLALVAGLGGFFLKYSSYFDRGATSLDARFDYWTAAGQTVLKHPVLGSGPGTFGPMYKKVKAPESEMAHLAHNDYLQQASDSGVIGALLFAGLIFAVMWQGSRQVGDDWMGFAIWLGTLGWALQAFTELNLYIPAVSWPAFTFLGWLVSRIRGAPQIASTTPHPASSLRHRT